MSVLKRRYSSNLVKMLGDPKLIISLDPITGAFFLQTLVSCNTSFQHYRNINSHSPASIITLAFTALFYRRG
jgi:hypothetical protein